MHLTLNSFLHHFFKMNDGVSYEHFYSNVISMVVFYAVQPLLIKACPAAVHFKKTRNPNPNMQEFIYK